MTLVYLIPFAPFARVRMSDCHSTYKESTDARQPKILLLAHDSL